MPMVLLAIINSCNMEIGLVSLQTRPQVRPTDTYMHLPACSCPAAVAAAVAVPAVMSLLLLHWQNGRQRARWRRLRQALPLKCLEAPHEVHAATRRKKHEPVAHVLHGLHG